MSIYPPGQGLMLAVGQLLGHPWIGIWLTAAFGCAAICWALQAWLPPRWALLGGVLAILQFGVLCYWTSTYYCTWLPAIGGALVLGALLRLRNRPRVSHALILALGTSVLALTRPYEGLFLCLPVAVLLLTWMFHPNKRTLRLMISRVAVPIFAVLIPTAAFMAYYSLRVTGNALLLPYVLNQQTYVVVPLFRWQHFRPEPRISKSAVARFLYRLGVVGVSQHNCGRLRENDLDQIQEILGVLFGADTQHSVGCDSQSINGQADSFPSDRTCRHGGWYGIGKLEPSSLHCTPDLRIASRCVAVHAPPSVLAVG